MSARRRRGHPILGAICGLFLGVFVAIDLVMFKVVPSDSIVLTVLPPALLVLGIVLGSIRRGVGPVAPAAEPVQHVQYPSGPPPQADPVAPAAGPVPAAGAPQNATVAFAAPPSQPPGQPAPTAPPPGSHPPPPGGAAPQYPPPPR